MSDQASGSSVHHRLSEKEKVHISKALSYILRHGASKEGLTLDEQGWVSLKALLLLPTFKKVSVATIKDIVSSSIKQRFALKEEDNKLFIRANQGHSILNIQPDLEELTLETLPATVIHGTYRKHWDSIKSSGLHHMSRIHIHMSPGPVGERHEVPGIRSSCQLHIYVDAASALAAGIQFFKSANNVILSPGNAEGYLPTKYFASVIDVKTGDNILSSSSL